MAVVTAVHGLRGLMAVHASGHFRQMQTGSSRCFRGNSAVAGFALNPIFAMNFVVEFYGIIFDAR